LYFLRDELKKNPDFIQNNKADLAASLQKTIVDILLSKLKKASSETGITEIALAGGVSANSGLREAILTEGVKKKWKVHIPKFAYTTDNAAMIAITGYYKFLKNDFAPLTIIPAARIEF
jgi:N6-L-threonylcarbamoyladenine synthase